jgi:hypothetical protein
VPGSYRVAVTPSKSNRKYALTVEECREAPNGNLD